MSTVKGRFHGHGIKHGFQYQYMCGVCGLLYLSSADEEEPLCHRCYNGGRRGVTHTVPSGKRKAKHKPQE